MAILMRSCKREPTGVARCIALSSIAMFVYRELSYKSQHRTVPEAIMVLLLALRVSYLNFVSIAFLVLLFLINPNFNLS